MLLPAAFQAVSSVENLKIPCAAPVQVCSCHSASEEEVLLPAARRLCPDKETAQRLSLKVGMPALMLQHDGARTGRLPRDRNKVPATTCHHLTTTVCRPSSAAPSLLFLMTHLPRAGVRGRAQQRGGAL